VEIHLPGYSLWLRAWQVKVGRLHVYLLDSNDSANYPAHRGITNELYGGGPSFGCSRKSSLASAAGGSSKL